MIVGLIPYNALATLAYLVCWPYLLAASLFGRRGKWSDRHGRVPCVDGRPIWIHAASMGEVGVIVPLIAELRARRPGQALAISTVTETGQARARDLFGRVAAVFFLPLDFLWVQARALRRIEPSLVILVETELWPNLIWLCHKRKVPVMLVNARLSERSLPHYQRFAFLFRPLLDTFRIIACQSEEDARRYRSIGVRPEIVRVLGNLKYDCIVGPVTPDERMKIRDDLGIPPDAVVMTAGSTREGEETLLIDAWTKAVQDATPRLCSGQECKIQNAILVIAPRHPDRFAEVESLLIERAVRYVTRNQQRKTGGPVEFDVLLLDSIGELVSAYAASDMAFVGGSLVPVGGHNPLEPAALGLPVVFGPHMFNAQESADSLLAVGGAKQVDSTDALSAVLCEWLGDPRERARIGKFAEQVVDARRGAVRKTIEVIESVLA